MSESSSGYFSGGKAPHNSPLLRPLTSFASSLLEASLARPKATPLRSTGIVGRYHIYYNPTTSGRRSASGIETVFTNRSCAGMAVTWSTALARLVITHLKRWEDPFELGNQTWG
jgi:hypothetical protein